MQIKPVEANDLHTIEQLIKNEYETLFKKEFTEEGQAVFESYIKSTEMEKRVIIDKTPAFKAVIKNTLVGYIELKKENRVSLFFVNSSYQKKGIGKQLLKELESTLPQEIRELEVHSSSVAVEAYKHLGFEQTGDAVVDWGIRYIPMVKQLGTSPSAQN